MAALPARAGKRRLPPPSPLLPTGTPLHVLDPLFRPAAVAVVGASTNLGKISGRPVASLMRHGYSGPLYPVNPGATAINGIPCYPEVAAIPGPVDAVFIALPAEQVEEALRACAAKGARAAVVYSSGFAEAGDAGLALQQRMVATAHALGMRVAGPNSLGIMNMREHIMLSASTAPTELALPVGQIGLVSQSGALGGALLTRGVQRGLCFRYVATSGNEADIGLAEYLDWMLEDPQTTVLATLFEGLRRPREFMAVCRKAAGRGVPVVALRIGRSVVGQRAAASHTGSMLDDSSAFGAAMRSLGVRLVEDLDTLVETAGLLAHTAHGAARLATGAGVAVVSHSGGGAILLTDILSEHDVPIAEFRDSTRADLHAVLPGWGTAQNPLDLTTTSVSEPATFERALDVVAADAGVAALAMVMSNTAARSPALHAALRRFRDRSATPCVVYTVDGQAQAHMQGLREAGIAVFDSATALALAVRAALSAERPAPGAAGSLPRASSDIEAWRARLAAAPEDPTEPEAKAVLAAAGIGAPGGCVIADALSARGAAAALGYPVVAKLVARGVHHKSELGGVVVNLADEDALEQAALRILAAARAAGIDDPHPQILIERMHPPVAELIVGARRHPDFGISILVGMGGIFTEVLGDRVVRAAPVSEDDALAMLKSLKSFTLLEGVRGRPRADVAAAVRAIAAFSRLAVALDDAIDVMEINPLGVLAEGKGALALDAVIIPARPALVPQETAAD